MLSQMPTAAEVVHFSYAAFSVHSSRVLIRICRLFRRDRRSKSFKNQCYRLNALFIWLIYFLLMDEFYIENYGRLPSTKSYSGIQRSVRRPLR